MEFEGHNRVVEDVIERGVELSGDCRAPAAEVIADVNEAGAVRDLRSLCVGRRDERDAAVRVAGKVGEVVITAVLRQDSLMMVQPAAVGGGLEQVLRAAGGTQEYLHSEYADEPPWPNTPIRYHLSALVVEPRDSNVLWISRGGWPMPSSSIAMVNSLVALMWSSRTRSCRARSRAFARMAFEAGVSSSLGSWSNGGTPKYRDTASRRRGRRGDFGSAAKLALTGHFDDRLHAVDGSLGDGVDRLVRLFNAARVPTLTADRDPVELPGLPAGRRVLFVVRVVVLRRDRQLRQQRLDVRAADGPDRLGDELRRRDVLAQ